MWITHCVKKALSCVRHSEYVRRIIDYEARQHANVIRKYKYVDGLPTIDILDLIPDLENTICPYSFLDGAASPIDMIVLMGLAKQIPKCSYFEIGGLRGESVANLAKLASECMSMSLSSEEMQALGYSSELIAAHHYFSKGLTNVTLLEHNSLTYDFSRLARKFDLIFIDGDHYHNSVRIDTQNAFKLLKNDESIIVWHDYGFSPGKIRWSVLAGILDGTPFEKRDKLYHVSNSMCAIYTNKKIMPLIGAPSDLPDKCFSLHVSLVQDCTHPK